MNRHFNRLAIGGGIAAITVGFAFAHQDDPKLRDRQARYEGPAYRADIDGGIAGLGGQFDSSDVTLESWLPLAEISPGATSGNDCWGYVSPSGREYALIGTSNGLGFVEVTNPGNAQLVHFESGPNSLWHDVKTYQNYAYEVSEGGMASASSTSRTSMPAS